MSHKKEHKASIIEFLLEKAKLDLLSGIEAHKNNRIEKEIQIGGIYDEIKNIRL
jgi:hypothetical protein